MGEMRLTEVQQELLANTRQQLEVMQQQSNIVLTALLAGVDVRKATNVRHEGNLLLWDEPDDGDDETPQGPQAVDDDAVDKVVKRMTADAKEVEGDPSGTAGPSLHEEGDSEGPEADVPESEEEVSEASDSGSAAAGEPAPEEEPATVH